MNVKLLNLHLRIVRVSFFVRTAATTATLSVLLLSCGKKPTAANSQASVNGSAPVDYSPRIGIAVRTDSRTCIAVKNGAIPANSPVTLVLPVSPQSFVEAQISGQSSSACPITEEVVPEMVSYDISLPHSSNVPKLTPLIAVVGTAASSSFLMANAGVQADVDQTHAKNTFRACGANDGFHLTVWRGIPVTGTLLWSGHYYEAGNPGTVPTCSATELAPLAPAHS
ncbi:MAG: hypothetical protein M3Y27_12415 [Acidobacteriota bacterium]|nr:hypothetical protein [Acidobacteriota bacterium]